MPACQPFTETKIRGWRFSTFFEKAVRCLKSRKRMATDLPFGVYVLGKPLHNPVYGLFRMREKLPQLGEHHLWLGLSLGLLRLVFPSVFFPPRNARGEQIIQLTFLPGCLIIQFGVT